MNQPQYTKQDGHKLDEHHGRVATHDGDRNHEMEPPSKKRLVINKRLTKFVRLETN